MYTKSGVCVKSEFNKIKSCSTFLHFPILYGVCVILSNRIEVEVSTSIFCSSYERLMKVWKKNQIRNSSVLSGSEFPSFIHLLVVCFLCLPSMQSEKTSFSACFDLPHMLYLWIPTLRNLHCIVQRVQSIVTYFPVFFSQLAHFGTSSDVYILIRSDWPILIHLLMYSLLILSLHIIHLNELISAVSILFSWARVVAHVSAPCNIGGLIANLYDLPFILLPYHAACFLYVNV